MLSIVGIIFIMPFAWMVANSVKDIRGIYKFPPEFIPEVWHFENYTEAWTATHFDIGFLNSALVAAAVVLGQLITASLAGYSFARLRYPGRDKIFLLYISLMMVPFTVLLIPLYIQMRAFGWVSTLPAVIVPFLFTPWGTFMMRQFMVTIPRELEDAARIDGCGFFRTYWLIILPLTKPALATLAIFTFVNTWNSYQWPLIVLAKAKSKDAAAIAGVVPESVGDAHALASDHGGFDIRRCTGVNRVCRRAEVLCPRHCHDWHQRRWIRSNYYHHSLVRNHIFQM